MGHLDQMRKNRRSNKPTPDINTGKYWEPDTYESLHITNTDTSHLTFSAKEKRDASTLTKQVGYLLLQERYTGMSVSYMNIFLT